MSDIRNAHTDEHNDAVLHTMIAHTKAFLSSGTEPRAVELAKSALIMGFQIQLDAHGVAYALDTMADTAARALVKAARLEMELEGK